MTVALQSGYVENIFETWASLCTWGGLDDAGLHVCGHSCASWALATSEGLPMIGQLLGRRIAIF